VGVDYESITTQRDLEAYCRRLAGAERIAFDTEFVSEDSYQPDLCLIQIASDRGLAIVDPKTVTDVRPFWELLADEGRETIVHAGREEYRFCRRAVGRWLGCGYDMQIASALVGLEYPASLQTLLGKLLGKNLPKGETRTDWRRRPLSRRQLEYALLDVAHLLALRDEIFARLEQFGRRAWLDEEMRAWQERLEEAESRERWRRVAGLSNMSSRQLAVAREIWNWREAVAEQRNRPPRRILRDDLLVELARRKTADPKRIHAVRGLQRRDLKAQMPEIAECIRRGLAVPDRECPQVVRRESLSQLNVVSQLLATAVATRCRSVNVAPALVSTVQDVRELVAYRCGKRSREDGQPPLVRGWRAEVVGQLIDDLLSGKLVVRIKDPLSEDPICFEPFARPPRD
jgi:ribonuclease D